MDQRQADAILGDNNWLAWLPVRHFLPAPLLKHLIRKILAAAGESLESHFSDIFLGDAVSSKTWLLKPAQEDSSVNDYWQRLIRRIIFDGAQSNVLLDSDQINADIRLLEFAISLDGVSISSLIDKPEYLAACNQRSFVKFIDTRNLVQTRFLTEGAEESYEKVQPIFDENSPLNVITLKYFGDLLFLEGNASAAKYLYSRSLEMISHVIQKLNCEPLLVWRDVIFQSRASAASELSDNSREADEFIRSMDSTDIKNRPLALLNGSLDAYIFLRKSDSFVADARVVACLPQLLKTSHDATHAVTLRLKKDYDGASHAFYWLQRRQLSLGLYYESRRTFGLWGQTLIEALSNGRKIFGATTFDAAVNFLLSSGDTKFVTDLSWPELLVDNCVDEAVAQRTADLLYNSNAVTQRRLIAVALIESWLRVIRSDSPACTLLLRGLIATVCEGENLQGNSALREYGAKALERITKSRQDFFYSEAGVGNAICSTIANGGFYEIISTLAVIENIIDHLSHADRARIVDSIVKLVDKPNAGKMGWPVLRPAMNILSDNSIIETLDFYGKSREYILNIIVQIGVENDSENASLLYQVRNFQDNLSLDHIEKIKNAISGVRENAQNPNRSNAVFNINALLATPEIVGHEGIKDALNGLRLILETGYNRQASPAFPTAYEVLRHLRNSDEKIAASLQMQRSDFISSLRWVFDEILRLWSAAVQSPQIFADFSFLPSLTPNDVIVHNWALETISFGSLFSTAESIRSHLEQAADDQQQLRQGIELAFATLATALPSFTSSSEVIEAETRNEFYSKLSRRLVAINKNYDGALWRAIFDRCLTLGPRAEDSAIFVCHKLEWLMNHSSKIDSYTQRVAANADLRILLMPLIENISNTIRLNQN